MNGKRLWKIVKSAGGWILSLIVLLPIYFILVNSLKTQMEAGSMNFSLPASPQWGNYVEAIQRGNLVRSFFNSLFIASASVVICVFVTSMAAFILARRKTRTNRLVYNYFFLGLVAPLNYIMTIFVLKALQLQNTYWGIILVYVAANIPFLMFLFHGFIGGIPKELDEAAVVDGSGLFVLFFRIIFPLLKPVTITGLVLNFLGAWNDFITPLYLLNDQRKLGMVNSIYNFFGYHFNDWNLIFADVAMTIMPVLVLYMFGQRYIISGMTNGSVKG